MAEKERDNTLQEEEMTLADLQAQGTGLDGEGQPEMAELEATEGAEAPEAEAPKGRRELFVGRMREKYPDRNFDDEEELFGAIGDDYDALESENEEYRTNNGKLVDLFRKNEQGASFLTDWVNGKDPVVGLIENYGDLFIEALNDPEKVNEIAAANQRYADKVAQNREIEEARKVNLVESLKGLAEFQEEEGLSDEEIDEVMTRYMEIADNLLEGRFTKEDVKMVKNALNYDSAVADAAKDGEKRGRNSKIKEQWKKPKGDGLPNLGGGSDAKESGPASSIFELANQAR